MPFVNPLDTVDPGLGEFVRLGASRIRTIAAAVQERLASVFVDTNANPMILKPDTVGSSQIIAAGVGTAEIADLAVTTAKLADASVTLAKLAVNAVDATILADGAVDTAAILNLAVTGAKLALLAVDTAQLAAGAVTSAKLAANAVLTANITDGNVTQAKLDAALAAILVKKSQVTQLLPATGGASPVNTLIAANDYYNGSIATTLPNGTPIVVSWSAGFPAATISTLVVTAYVDSGQIKFTIKNLTGSAVNVSGQTLIFYALIPI